MFVGHPYLAAYASNRDRLGAVFFSLSLRIHDASRRPLVSIIWSARFHEPLRQLKTMQEIVFVDIFKLKNLVSGASLRHLDAEFRFWDDRVYLIDSFYS